MHSILTSRKAFTLVMINSRYQTIQMTYLLRTMEG